MKNVMRNVALNGEKDFLPRQTSGPNCGLLRRGRTKHFATHHVIEMGQSRTTIVTPDYIQDGPNGGHPLEVADPRPYHPMPLNLNY